jgi:hypothetical protein
LSSLKEAEGETIRVEKPEKKGGSQGAMAALRQTLKQMKKG